MTQFQKEIAMMALLLAFLFACSVYVETARIGTGAATCRTETREGAENANQKNESFSSSISL